jgi:hypothetical protein
MAARQLACGCCMVSLITSPLCNIIVHHSWEYNDNFGYPSTLIPPVDGQQQARWFGGCLCPAQEDGLLFYSFPNLQQLEKATEEALRAAGFGYR